MSGEKLLAQLTHLYSLHKRTSVASVLLIGVFYLNTYNIFYLQKHKKKSSNKVLKLILFLPLSSILTRALLVHAVLLWPCEAVPIQFNLIQFISIAAFTIKLSLRAMACTGGHCVACGFSTVAPVSSYSAKRCPLLWLETLNLQDSWPVQLAPPPRHLCLEQLRLWPSSLFPEIQEVSTLMMSSCLVWRSFQEPLIQLIRGSVCQVIHSCILGILQCIIHPEAPASAR